jgi:threonylcarbamoyladenosine tRNA methylthiotransferase MtaB
MARKLRAAGWRVVDRLTPEVDAIIVNSCSVTHVADQKSRHLVRQAQRLAPNATVAFTGCMVETALPSNIEALGADLVYRQPDQAELAEQLIALYPASLRPSTSPGRTGEAPPSSFVLSEPALSLVEGKDEQQHALKTRAFIAAQEGCNDVCAFCIIPRTRGRERSKSIEAIVEEARAREAEGAQEIVITGTQLGAYGRDRGERALAQAIEALLRNTSLPRIRISSVQPQDLSPRLIDLWQDTRLCPHFHLALQSGSETVLQRMRRRYSATEYAAAVESLRRAVPDVAITTDVIAGFPGETDAEFEETYTFCREMAFATMHVFPYSQRQGTSAVKLPGQVSDPVKKQRVHRLIALGEELSGAYRQRFVGSKASVLWETQRDEVWEGLTGTYIRVRSPARGDDLHNRLTAVRLTAVSEDGMQAEVMEE